MTHRKVELRGILGIDPAQRRGDIRRHPPPGAAIVRQPEAAPDELASALAAIDPDSLTPREALEELYRLKRIAAEREP